MSTFSHLKRFEGQETARIEVPELGENAWIECRPASERNKPYYSAMLKLAGRRLRTIVRGKIDPADVAKNRAEDRVLFPKYIISNWGCIESGPETPKNQLDKNGHIKYTPELAVELCETLPDNIFDRVRNFAATPEEFYSDEDLPPSGKEVAGN